MIVAIPMAGGDDAFRDRAGNYGKALVEVRGRPLIQHVVENLKSIEPSRFVFILRKEDALRSFLADVLRLMVPGCDVVVTDDRTGGAACSVLLAIDSIASDEELVVTNSDQLLMVNLSEAIQEFRRRDLDGGTLVFDSVHPRWSFVRIGNDGFISEAAEKRPISRWATAGFYYFKHGREFVAAACEMVRKGASVNGAYYVCPIFNEMILKHLRVGAMEIKRSDYVSLATPQSIEEYEHKGRTP